MTNDQNGQTAGAAPAERLAIDLAVFGLLVTIGVVGRLGQPAWNFTPMAAVALFAGAYFANRWVAVLVPTAAMAITNLWLPAYEPAVMLTVYAMLAAPALAGPWLRRNRVKTSQAWWARLAVSAVAPSVAFFVVTNAAVWSFMDLYPKTAGGLLGCYAAAVPFFRQMLAGDVLYVGGLFTAAAWMGVGFAKATQPSVPTPVAAERRPAA